MLRGIGSARLGALLTLGIPLLIAQDPGLRLVTAARAQLGVTVAYDPRYTRIPYPGGDVPLDRGVCTDVLIRAYRAQGLDLQKLVHEDMGRAWEAYPRSWGLKARDRNIDHRRVPNLATFFARHGQSLALSHVGKAYVPGDSVTGRLASGGPPPGLISDRRSPAGHPLVIHNIGAGVREEDRLFAYTLTGHYRYPAPTPRPQAQAASRSSRAE